MLPPPANNVRGDSTLRRTIHYLIMAGVLALLVRTWVVQGLIVPIVVNSGSMADVLLGPHRDVTCADCGRRFACGLELLPAAGRAVCPNCGSQTGDPDSARDRAGDRLLIDRSVFQLRAPRRWEMAVFGCPHDPGQICIKRIVGLPGESIEIRGGRVFVDGQIAHKTLADWRAMAVLVNDGRFEASAGGRSSRWKTTADSRWRHSPGHFSRTRDPQPSPSQMAGSPAEPIAWLVYEHSQPQTSGEPRPGPITDDMAYNQNESRQLNEVRDILLQCRLMAQGRGSVWLRASDGRDTFVLGIDAFSGRTALERNGEAVATCTLGANPLAQARNLALLLAGGRLQLVVDSREVLVYPYETPSGNLGSTASPLAIGARDVDTEIGDLQVWRDVYYLPGPDPYASAGHRLAADEYFVLGDNSSLSEDSRQWLPEGRVHEGLLLGTPLLIWRH